MYPDISAKQKFNWENSTVNFEKISFNHPLFKNGIILSIYMLIQLAINPSNPEDTFFLLSTKKRFFENHLNAAMLEIIS